MAIQALNLLQTIIQKNEISDTDILINTIHDYIKNNLDKKNEEVTSYLY